MHRDFYQRRLPHLQPLGGTFFVTYRLRGSLPASVRQALQEEWEAEKSLLSKAGQLSAQAVDTLSRRYFGRYDNWLDQPTNGPKYLADNAVAQLVVDSFRQYDGKRMELIAYAIMATHVHVVFTLLGDTTEQGTVNSLSKLMHSLKGFTGRAANRLLGLEGSFWDDEWYDRYVRNDDELIRIVRYVLNNPVKAGLCAEWRDWPWSYVKPDYDMF